jgi:hypothetical protein
MWGMTALRRRPGDLRLRLSGILIGLALLGTACAGSGYQYVADRETQSFFKIPNGWKLFDQQDLFPDAPSSNPFRDEQNPTQFVMGFSANPSEEASSFPRLDAGTPEGFALVHMLSDSERDQASLGLIRNAFVPIDQMYQQDSNSVVLYASEDISDENGLRGSHMVFSLRESPDPTRPYTGSVTVNQTGLFDPQTEKLYLFAVFCTSDCYQQHEKTIERIADSWKVSEQP